MDRAARPVIIAARLMTIVYVPIVSTFEPLSKVIIAHCNQPSNYDMLLVPGWQFKSGTYLAGLISEDQTAYKDLNEAMKSCNKYGSCGGVTHDQKRKVYELRAGREFVKSTAGERTWRKKTTK